MFTDAGGRWRLSGPKQSRAGAEPRDCEIRARTSWAVYNTNIGWNGALREPSNVHGDDVGLGQVWVSGTGTALY